MRPLIVANALIGLLIAKTLTENVYAVVRYASAVRMTELAVRNEIRRWRQENSTMTQAELARLCGVTRQTIIALEAGKYSPSLELAFRLARALGRNLEEVFRYRRKKIVDARTASRPIGLSFAS